MKIDLIKQFPDDMTLEQAKETEAPVEVTPAEPLPEEPKEKA